MKQLQSSDGIFRAGYSFIIVFTLSVDYRSFICHCHEQKLASINLLMVDGLGDCLLSSSESSSFVLLRSFAVSEEKGMLSIGSIFLCFLDFATVNVGILLLNFFFFTPS